MKNNMGTADRVIRTVLGLAIGLLGILFESWWGLVGLIPLGTALVGTCPIYLPFGVSTKRKPAPRSEEELEQGSV
jgi:uncharacterized protein (DUF58 family)